LLLVLEIIFHEDLQGILSFFMHAAMTLISLALLRMHTELRFSSVSIKRWEFCTLIDSLGSTMAPYAWVYLLW
jgi:hypothetical protein